MTPSVDYPITITEDYFTPRIRSLRRCMLALGTISFLILVYYLYDNKFFLSIVSGTMFVIFYSLYHLYDNFDDPTSLTIDDTGIAVKSLKSESRNIFLAWQSITGVHYSFNSPLVNKERFNLLLKAYADTDLPSNSSSSQLRFIAVSYELPRRPEWRDGRELREYHFSKTFGMSEHAFFEFLSFHFERNKRV